MLIMIIAISVMTGICYWLVKTAGKIPNFISWLLFVCFLPFCFFYALFKTLPDFKKGGKYHGARWIVYFTAFAWIALIVILLA